MTAIHTGQRRVVPPSAFMEGSEDHTPKAYTVGERQELAEVVPGHHWEIIFDDGYVTEWLGIDFEEDEVLP